MIRSAISPRLAISTRLIVPASGTACRRRRVSEEEEERAAEESVVAGGAVVDAADLDHPR
jgi:hypothetical protein